MLIKLPPNVAALAKLAAKEPSKFSMMGVRVRQTEDGYRCEASNGKMLGIVEGTDALDTEHYFDDAPNGATEVILPSKEFVAAVKDARPHALMQLGYERVTAQTNLDGHRVQIKPLEGGYPDVDEAVNTSCPRVEVWVNAKFFRDLLDVAIQFTEDNHKVLLRYWDPDSPLVVVSETGTQRFLGLLMPLTGNGVKVKDGTFLVTTKDLTDNPDKVAPVSGNRCRSCGKRSTNAPRDAVWLVENGTAYCFGCRAYEPEEEPVIEPQEEEEPDEELDEEDDQ